MLFAALALAATYPLLSHAGTHIPQGSEPSATVPLLNLWTVWWNVDRISHGFQGYWNAPMYHGVPGIFAALEPQTAVGLLAWLPWQILPQQAHVFNALIALFLTLNGWFSCQLLKRWRLTWLTSLCGGAMVSVLPFVHWKLGVFQLIAVWGILWTLLALTRFQRQQGLGAAFHLAFAFAITYSLCCYYGLFLSLLLLVCAPLLLGRTLRRGRTWVWGVTAIAIACGLLAPIVSTQLRFAREHPFEYPPEWIRVLSAVPTDYLQTPGPQFVTPPEVDVDDSRKPWPLSPGTLKIMLAGIGFGWGVWSRRRRRASLMLGGMAVVALLLSMGPRLEWGGVSIYRFLADYYPGFGHARNVFRFACFVQIAIALLAAFGVHGVHRFLKRRPFLAQRRFLASTAMLLLGGLLVCEAWPSPPSTYRLPANAAACQWVSWLSDEQQSEVCLAFFPQAADTRATASQPTAEWMYFQSYHARPMINGYSTFVPGTISELNEILASFPSDAGVAALHKAGVTHVAFDQRVGAKVDRPAMETLGLAQVVNDTTAAMEIWQLPQAD